MYMASNFTDDNWTEFYQHLRQRLAVRAAEEGMLLGQWVILERVIAKACADVYGQAHQEIRAYHGGTPGIGE